MRSDSLLGVKPESKREAKAHRQVDMKSGWPGNLKHHTEELQRPGHKVCSVNRHDGHAVCLTVYDIWHCSEGTFDLIEIDNLGHPASILTAVFTLIAVLDSARAVFTCSPTWVRFLALYVLDG